MASIMYSIVIAVYSSVRLHDRYRERLQSDRTSRRLDHQGLSAQLGAFKVPSEASAFVHYTIIGALLTVMLGKSRSGQPRWIYKNQAAVIEAITEQFPGLPGLANAPLIGSLPRLAFI
jgi:hypothetical protein